MTTTPTLDVAQVKAVNLIEEAANGLAACVYTILGHYPPEQPFGNIVLTEDDQAHYDMHRAMFCLAIAACNSAGIDPIMHGSPPEQWVRHVEN